MCMYIMYMCMHMYACVIDVDMVQAYTYMYFYYHTYMYMCIYDLQCTYLNINCSILLPKSPVTADKAHNNDHMWSL